MMGGLPVFRGWKFLVDEHDGLAAGYDPVSTADKLPLGLLANGGRQILDLLFPIPQNLTESLHSTVQQNPPQPLAVNHQKFFYEIRQSVWHDQGQSIGI